MLNRNWFTEVVSTCAGSALLTQADEVMARFRWRDLLEQTKLVLANCGTDRALTALLAIPKVGLSWYVCRTGILVRERIEHRLKFLQSFRVLRQIAVDQI